MDFSKLEMQPRSYINEVRQESEVDVLFKTTIDNKKAYLYFLLEHQSKPDPLMPFRLLKYPVMYTPL
ncbi:TPA: Rpn family recombination-promoting nuclease/putative transposase [Legionella anisa]|uniref:Rpn family recombination-promoting nuclease/putative transposase n=1 Tax=Legionella anisa TaxID=28082 RepID=UPI003B968194